MGNQPVIEEKGCLLQMTPGCCHMKAAGYKLVFHSATNKQRLLTKCHLKQLRKPCKTHGTSRYIHGKPDVGSREMKTPGFLPHKAQVNGEYNNKETKAVPWSSLSKSS